MPNPVAYNPSTPPSGGFQRATITYGLSGSNYGENSPGGLTYYNSLPTSSAWVIISDSYTLGFSTQQNAKPVMWSTGSASTGSLIRLINGLPSMTSSFTDYYSAVNWLQSTNKYFLLNNGYENIVTDGLVLNLDAGWWNSYPTTGTTWTDLSGIGNNGTLTNGPTFNSANSGSIVFDGVDDLMSTSCNIEAATSANLQTLCSWVFGTSNENSFFGSGASTTGMFHVILNYESNGQLRFAESYYGGGQAPFDQTNVVTVSSNSTWNHACIVKTAVSTYDVYFNGTKVITGATKAATHPSPFYLGRWWIQRPCLSRTANVQIYNRALSSDEILQNYNAQKGRFGL